ncbi:MAG: hypothetical protein WC521_08035 [Bdellovibrionales bacterium]|jgi:hypothetical protein
MEKTKGDLAIQKMWDLAEAEYDAAEYACGLALMRGLLDTPNKPRIATRVGQEYIDRALSRGRSMETLERVCQSYFFPAITDKTPAP